MLVEMVKLIQSALVLWGMVEDDVVGDGLFCDETKKGIFAWRRAMGMEHEESMRMAVSEEETKAADFWQKETSGGCIDPKTLSALLSSITSVRYQLAALGSDRVSLTRKASAELQVPKNPFSNTRQVSACLAFFPGESRTNRCQADSL